MTLCIIGEGSINHELFKINRKFSLGRRLAVTHKTHTAPLDKLCEMVYIHNTDYKATKMILDKLNGCPVLTISDRNQFSRQGGGVELYRSGNQIHFSINTSSLKRSELEVSSKLLSLA